MPLNLEDKKALVAEVTEVARKPSRWWLPSTVD